MPQKQETPAGDTAGASCDSFAGLSPFPLSFDGYWAQFPNLAAHCGTDWLANLATSAFLERRP